MYTERKEMIDDIFTGSDLSALIFWRPDELVLMLGYLPLWGLSVLVYTADHQPVLLVPELEPGDLLPKGITVKKFPWGAKNCTDPWGILYKEIRNVLEQKGISLKPVSFIKNIGGTAPCRMSGEQPPLPADFTDCLCKVSEGGFKDATTAILNLYQFKTQADIDGLKLAHFAAAAGVKEFYAKIKPGITESKLAALIECTVNGMIGQNDISFARAWPLVQSGENAADGGKYNRTTGRVIAERELVMLEMGICVNGYWADITRTAITGEPSELQLKMYETVRDAQHMAIKMLRPGIPMHEVDAAARNHIEDAGFGAYFNHPLGHQVGFRYHDPGAGFAPSSNNILQEGMVLTVEPGIYGAVLKAGVRIEDNVLITANGYTVLSDFSRNL